MKTTFDNFILANPVYKKFETNSEAKYVFEQILSKDENIIEMIELSEHKKPALIAVVEEIESYYDNSNTKDLDLLDNFTKQGVGRMIRWILEPFGYTVAGQKDLPRNLKSKYFTSATRYELTATQKLKVVKTIVEVK